MIDLQALAKDLRAEGLKVRDMCLPRVLHIYGDNLLWIKVWRDGRWEMSGDPVALNSLLPLIDLIRKHIEGATK